MSLMEEPTREAASAALDQYKKLIKPIKQREAKYCEKVGATTTVQFSRKVIANLDFMRKLSSTMSKESRGSESAAPSVAHDSNISDLSKSDVSSVSTVSQASCPLLMPNSSANNTETGNRLRTVLRLIHAPQTPPDRTQSPNLSQIECPPPLRNFVS